MIVFGATINSGQCCEMFEHLPEAIRQQEAITIPEKYSVTIVFLAECRILNYLCGSKARFFHIKDWKFLFGLGVNLWTDVSHKSLTFLVITAEIVKGCRHSVVFVILRHHFQDPQKKEAFQKFKSVMISCTMLLGMPVISTISCTLTLQSSHIKISTVTPSCTFSHPWCCSCLHRSSLSYTCTLFIKPCTYLQNAGWNIVISSNGIKSRNCYA